MFFLFHSRKAYTFELLCLLFNGYTLSLFRPLIPKKINEVRDPGILLVFISRPGSQLSYYLSKLSVIPPTHQIQAA